MNPEEPKRPPILRLGFIATLCVLLFALSTAVFWWQETKNPFYVSLPHSLSQFLSGKSFQEDYTNQTKEELENY